MYHKGSEKEQSLFINIPKEVKMHLKTVASFKNMTLKKLILDYLKKAMKKEKILNFIK